MKRCRNPQERHSRRILFIFIVFMKTLASPAKYGIFDPQKTGSSIGEGSMKTVNTGTVVPLEKCPFRAFPSRPALYAGRLLTGIIFILNISCNMGDCAPQQQFVREEKSEKTSVNAFQGELLLFDMSFWIFAGAAKGSISFERNKTEYVAILEAETCGISKYLTGNKKEVMKSIMEYDKEKGRLRPRMFQEQFSKENNERKRTISYDYEKGTYTVTWERTGKKKITKTKKLPENDFDDLLSFFYNFRLGYYGEAKKDKKFSILVLVSAMPSYISILFEEKNRAINRAWKHFATVSMERGVSETRSKKISGWFSEDFVPLFCVIEDAYFFGDIQIKLKERKNNNKNVALD